MPNDRPHMSVPTSYQRATLRICLLLLSLAINDVINLESTSQYQSRLGAENEDDQAAFHRLPTDEKLPLGREILKALRLAHKPKSTKGKAALINQSAGKFLINMYKHTANKKSDEKPYESLELSEFDLTENDFRTIEQSDVIIAFAAQQTHQGGKDLMWFNIDAVPPECRMTSAKLMFYRALHEKNLENRGVFIVTAHRVLRPKDGEMEMQFVDSAKTTAEHEGWISLDVTESLRHWMKHPDDNKGLYLSVRPVDQSSNQTRFEDIGIVPFDGDAERQPFMAGFFRTNEHHKAEVIEPTLRNLEVNKRNKKRETSNRKAADLCKVKKLYVSFEDLQWDDWIVFPKGFDANYCSGACKIPLTSYMNATNHAVVQSMVNTLHPEKMPKTCCVPTELRAIDVLYYLEGNTTVLRKQGMSNMSVQSCGCR